MTATDITLHGFWAACKPGFSISNFDLQMSNYATILTQTYGGVKQPQSTLYNYSYPSRLQSLAVTSPKVAVTSTM